MKKKELQTDYAIGEGVKPEVGHADGGGDVQRAKDEAIIAENRQKAELCRQNFKDITEFKQAKLKLEASWRELEEAREAFSQEKEEWLIDFDSVRQEELSKIKKVKIFWEERKDTLADIDADLKNREARLLSKADNLEEQESKVEGLTQGLEVAIATKEAQIKELQDIIDKYAPEYYEMFKGMLEKAEVRRNWNYNMARADQWHNLCERISIIFSSLHEMLFG